MLCHGITQTYWKKIFKEGNKHAMFLITSVSSYGHVLKKIIFGRILMNKSLSFKCLTAKGRPYNSYPFLPNRLWWVINILFYFQMLLNFFDKYVWCLTTHICVNICFRSRNENRGPKYQDEQAQIHHQNKSTMSTNVKLNINKLSTNKRCQFLGNILLRD
jgi:hypothetical protein